MSDKPDSKAEKASPYERARDLAEDALAEYAKGDREKGDRLAEDAVEIDRKAVEDVVRDLEEDARDTDAGEAQPGRAS